MVKGERDKDQLDLVDFTLGRLLERAVNREPDKVALIFPLNGDSMTYREFSAEVDRWCSFLSESSVKLGDRVGVMLSNRIEYPVVWFAIAQLGAVMVTINANFRSVDARHLIEWTESRLVIGERKTMGVLQDVASAMGDSFAIVDVDSLGIMLVPSRLESTSVVPDMAVNIQFTSGTSGLPKGCILSHRYWMVMAHKNVNEVPGLGSRDVILTAQPFSYMDPQWSLASAVAAVGTLVVLDRFHPSTFWQAVAEHDVTFFYCLGVMPRLMLQSPVVPAERAHKLRVVCCSGIPAEAHAELEARFNVPWLETYGMTEIGNGAAMRLEEADRHVGTGVIGRATSRRDLRVVDESGITLPRGTEGELVVRGVGLMDGYYNDEKSTAEAFRNGWFRTGDVVVMDLHGFISFRQRRKDIIRRSGENISALEVEAVVGQYPGVLFVACVPVSDELRGEEVKAFVVLQEGTNKEVVESELPDFCGNLLAYFKVPRYWEVVEELPLTASSKVAKSELLAQIQVSGVLGWDRVKKTWN